FYLVGDHGLYSRDVVGLRGYRVEVEGLGWRCGCHVWLLPVGGRVRPGLVVVRVVWGMRAPPPPWRLSCHVIRWVGFYPMNAAPLDSSRISHSRMLIGFPFVGDWMFGARGWGSARPPCWC